LSEVEGLVTEEGKVEMGPELLVRLLESLYGQKRARLGHGSPRWPEGGGENAKLL